MTVTIKHRWDNSVLFAGEYASQRKAVEAAIAADIDLTGADLRGFDLSGADLRGAKLRGSDFNGADLRRADLIGADLRGSKLRDADLRGAKLCGGRLRGAKLIRAKLRGADLGWSDLREADLRGAKLRWANLRGANLRGARLSWTSHDLVSEILRREAGDDVLRLQAAELVLTQRQWCWREFLAIDHPQSPWALGVLRAWVRAGNDVPEVLAAS